MMREGAVLRWNTKTQRAYVDGSLTRTFVRRLAASAERFSRLERRCDRLATNRNRAKRFLYRV